MPGTPACTASSVPVPMSTVCGMDTREAAQRWADVWERGWGEHDAAAITALYAEGAFWQQHPFRDPEPGYLAGVFAEEESAQCQFDAPIVDVDQAAVPWSAQTQARRWRHRESGGGVVAALQRRRPCPGRAGLLEPELTLTAGPPAPP